MKAGKMVHVITMQRMTATVNAAGTPVQSWADLATLRAEKVEQTTAEFIRGHGASDETVVVFRTRFLADLTTADRISFRGQVFNIKELSPIERRRGLELRCVATSGVS